ncbi:MAG: DNA mismatch repair protein MutS [Acutalibacteraceae bacterium]|nr:DNA mismatch repair protein MutS [Acutalibacteraceae bacterium]
MAELSPMMRQYLEIKENNKDCIIFFRVGDFYEMFFEDAENVSDELDLVLTGKDCGLSERAPMCGVPYHACENYIQRLVEKGYKVAICEQVEDPAAAKGLVKREIVRIITPGTIIEDNMLDEGKNNFLCSVSVVDGVAGICFADASTGEAYLTELSGQSLSSMIADEIGRFAPKEILLPDDYENDSVLKNLTLNNFEYVVSKRSKSEFDIKVSESVILSHFRVISVQNLGFGGEAAESALGAVIRYLYETGITGNIAVNQVKFYVGSQFMRLDMTAIRNLEIIETMRSKSRKGSLLWVLDKTQTAMGKRLMKSWLEQPLMTYNLINLRQNAVEELYTDTFLRGELFESLRGIRDIERIMSKVVYGTGSARDLRAICSTIERLPAVKSNLEKVQSRMLCEVNNDIDLLDDIRTLIDAAIVDEPPALVREGGMIKVGYNDEVDSLREIMTNGTGVLAQIEAREKERTGIKTLKVKYNKVFGYYIEVTNSFLDLVPEDYIRKQTLTGGERFITEELKALEGKLLGAKDRVIALEYELFDEVRKKVAAALERLQKTAAALARLDVLCSFAKVSVENNYCRPRMNDDGTILIKSGRHPVVEKLTNTPFVSNDTFLNGDGDRCAIITGPNMAGKSTYMRQVAIIVLMAQIGCFVPAQSANISICDAIFTRVGASDDLASGQSTFMVEMSEVATILKNATNKSLLILDEIGRGTSTFDGMSIARAVLEYVADKKKIGAKSLFATHYHELTQMENEMSGVKNYNIAVKKRGDDIIFLRRIVPGGADESYGIEVAKLSGIPSGVIKRAKEILKQTEEEGLVTYKTVVDSSSQLPLEMMNASEILAELKAIDVNTLTPIESMKILYDLVNKAKE